MSDRDDTTKHEDKARRAFLKKAAGVAVATPAVTMLMSVGSRKALAGSPGTTLTSTLQ